MWEQFDNKKYSKIILFLKMKNIKSVNEINADELYFIPGVSENLILDFLLEVKNQESGDKGSLKDKMNEVVDCTCNDDEIVKSPLDITITKLYELYDSLDSESFKNIYNKYKKELKKFEDRYTQSEDNLICFLLIKDVYRDVIKGPKFIEYCTRNGWKTLGDLDKFDFENTRIGGIGPNNLQNLKNVYNANYNLIKSYDVDNNIIENVHTDNYNIKLKNLVYKGISNNLLTKYDLMESKIGYLQSIVFQPDEYFLLKNILKEFEESVVSNFYNKLLFGIKEKFKRIFFERIKGRTLESIAIDEGITRERVRQIANKVFNIVHDDALLVLDAIIFDEKRGCTSDDIRSYISDEEVANSLIYISKNLEEYQFLEYSSRCIRIDMIPKYYFEVLKKEINSVLVTGVNFYELQDILSTNIKDYEQPFFSQNDLKNFLIYEGYKVFGDYIFKSRVIVSDIVHDAVLYYYTFDIKLDNDKNNQDMIKLRNIIYKQYPDVVLPENNRALTACVQRYSRTMILSGRGRYCPVEKVEINDELIYEIYTYIIETPLNTIYYSDLFEYFKAKLLMETSIDNYNFLHGVLLWKYPDEFVFSRDYVTKKGEVVNTSSDVIVNMIKSKGTSITFNEIKSQLPSITNLKMSFIVARNKSIIYIGNGNYNIVDNIKNGMKSVDDLMENWLKKNNNYISSPVLYEIFKVFENEFLLLNSIEDDKGLFYILSFLCSNKFKFRYPHIMPTEFSANKMSVFEIAKEILEFQDYFDWNKFNELAKKMKWHFTTVYSVQSILTEQYCKLSESLFIKKDKFYIDEVKLEKIKSFVSAYCFNSGYYSLFSIHEFDDYPEVGYEWNTFLLETIIENSFREDYRVLMPNVKDRRYQRSIIVSKRLAVNTYRALVYMILYDDGRSIFTEMELYTLLSSKDVIYKMLPQEILSAEYLTYKNELYILDREYLDASVKENYI